MCLQLTWSVQWALSGGRKEGKEEGKKKVKQGERKGRREKEKLTLVANICQALGKRLSFVILVSMALQGKH